MMDEGPIELAIELRYDSYSVIHAHFTPLSNSLMVFLTSNAPGESGTSISAMGSFVYAMPMVGLSHDDCPRLTLASAQLTYSRNPLYIIVCGTFIP